MRCPLRLLIIVSICGIAGIAATAGFAAPADDLSITLDNQGQIIAITAAGQALPVNPAAFVSLAEVGGSGYVAATVTGGDPQQGLQLDFGALGATAVLKITPQAEGLRVECDLQGADRPDRGLTLRFALPVQAEGWQWHDDMQTKRTITADKIFENTTPLRAYADLPEWDDQPALRLGMQNRNFCNVITGSVGLCLAVPMDQPSASRTVYNGPDQCLEHIYEFALSPLTKEPRRVRFSFDLYLCDPAWGLRSALQHYYARYPEMFRVHISQQGQWMAFRKLSEIDNANEFYFALQEGAPEVAYDDQIDVLSTIYYVHAGMPGNLPAPYDPEKDPLPPYEEQVAAMEKAFKAATGQDDVYDKVGIRLPSGQLAVEKWRVYAHLIAQFNPDPDLPYGEFLLQNTQARTQFAKEKQNGDLDGFYYDGLPSGINYATEHFKTADAPPMWNPVESKPFLNNFFSAVEFARATAELLRPQGQITMMNGALGGSFYVMPWLDVLGAETGLRIPRSDFNFIRSAIYHKPFMTLLKGNYEQNLGHDEIELFMKRCLAYGAFPGFFDWPPSGLGPGGTYWDHPRYYERDRDLFRKYLPLCRTLALAGWEPITYAHSSNPEVHVERFGPTPEGLLWLTLLNETSQPHTTRLTIASKDLELPAGIRLAVDAITGQTVPLTVEGENLVAELAMEADGVMALQIAPPTVAAQWRVKQARETIERGEVMRRVDAPKGPVATHWVPGLPIYERKQEGEASYLVLAATADRGLSARQWAMTFQQNPSPLTLRVRVRAQNLAADQAFVRCRIAWVTSSYTHYQNADCPIPAGSYDWREITLTLPAEQALRAVQIMPTINKGEVASVEFSRISLTGADNHDYIIDPEFTEWYEPLPPALRDKLQPGVEQLEQSLATLEQALASSVRTTTAPPALEDACRQIKTLQDTVTEAGAENAARRLRRDLATVNHHLASVGLFVYRLGTPTLTAPPVVAPNEPTLIAWSVPAVKGITFRTELTASTGVITSQGGRDLLTIPAQTPPGTVVTLRAQLNFGPPGAEISWVSERQLTVVPAVELQLAHQGADALTGEIEVTARLTNHRHQATQVQLAVAPPAGWQAAPVAPVNLPAAGQGQSAITLIPQGEASGGVVEFTVSVQAGPDSLSRRLSVLYIPPEENLIRNPGFEEGLANWALISDASGLQTGEARSGQACLRLENLAPTDSQASQGINLNQKTPTPVLVQAACRAHEVSGEPGKNFSLYIDLYYMDGSPQYGIAFPFETGTTDWQLGELYIEPAKPIRTVNVYLLLRGKSGQACFDNVALMEDTERRGNWARQAEVQVDSRYTGYKAAPLTDGITRVEGLHWTEEAWASADKDTDHWVELKLPEAKTLNQARVYWSLDEGEAKTSQEIHLQTASDEGWQTVATVQPPAGEAITVINWPEALTSHLRLWQPRGKGSLARPNLLWIREIELYGPEEQ